MNLRKNFLYSLSLTALYTFNVQTNISHAQKMIKNQTEIGAQNISHNNILSIAGFDINICPFCYQNITENNHVHGIIINPIFFKAH